MLTAPTLPLDWLFSRIDGWSHIPQNPRKEGGSPLKATAVPHRLGFGFKCTPPIASTMTDKNYVLRPWSKEEDADFERFCASIGEIPEDPTHARLMEDGEIDFFNLDEWWDLELPQA